MSPPPARRTPVTESPWYWVYLFSTAGLVALLLMGERFATRQAQIERTSQGRQRAVQQATGREPSAPLSTAERTTIRLWPLYWILGGLLLLAWIRLFWNRWRPGRREAS